MSNMTNVTGVQVDWKNISVTANADSTRILNNLSGCARPGELLAIMGSSGAGKTTFMNVLTQRNLQGLAISGEISVNGVQVTPDNIYKLSGYIQQDDVFIAAMTVKEHLMFHARMRLSTMSSKAKKIRVNEVAKIMGLERCLATKIGTPGLTKTLSGGELKRVSIATEILNNPPVLFADEPTSGLDSYIALTVMNNLKQLAASGTTILCTIHQPNSDIFETFGNLMLLSMVGHHIPLHSFFTNNLLG